MTKGTTRTKLMMLAMGLLLYVSTVFFAVWSDLQTGANYDDLSVRTTSNTVGPSNTEIKFLSPWGSETKLIMDSHGVWRIPNNEKRLVAKVIVKIREHSIAARQEFKCTFEEGPIKGWNSCELRRSEKNAENYELVLPTRSSILFPKYDNTINWKGDLILFLRPSITIAYSFILLGLILLAIFVHRRKICKGAREIYRSFKPGRGEILIGITVFGVFALLNFRHADLPTVMYRQFDELSILLSIESQSITKWIYGLLFNATSLPFLLPGLLTDNFSWSIFGGRMQSALFMIFSALIFRRILSLQFRGIPLALLSFFPLLVPFYWIMGTLYHPDAQMTTFLLGSSYFLLKDRGEMDLHLHIACFFFAAAVAIKFHALMFSPLIALYLLTGLLQRRSAASLKSVFSATAVVFVSYLALEPRSLLLSHLRLITDAFFFQMWTNKTGFSLVSNNVVTLSDKLSTISAYYSPMVLLMFLTLVSVGVLVYQIFTRRVPLAYLYATIFIVIVYHVFFLNKNWPYYYISPYFLFLVLAMTQAGTLCLKPQIGKAFAAGIIAMQLLIPWGSWGLVMADFYMPSSQARLDLNKTNTSLLNIFSEMNRSGLILISYQIPFDYRSLGIDSSQVKYITTKEFIRIKEMDYSFLEELQPRYIILSRTYTNTNYFLLPSLIKRLPSLGYERIFQDKVAEVYVRKY